VAPAADGPETALDEPLEVALAHARWRHFFWAALGLGFGALFLWSFGPVGKLFGACFAVGGALAARAFARTLAHEPGSIFLDAHGLKLTPEPCAGRSVTLRLDDLRHAYLLRRGAPLGATVPLLVLETSLGVFSFARDAFEHDGDQRKLHATLNRRLGRS
jgi:hypothetical protein